MIEHRSSTAKRPLPAFLALNPFPDPYLSGFFYREKMRAIHRVAPDAGVADVLEVGGGRSGLTAMLYPEARVVNLDADPAHADAPCNRQERVTFVTGDATDLPFGDESFDAVTMFDVLEHIPDDRRAVREALRVLKPGGAILVSTPNEHWRYPYYDVLKPICPAEDHLFSVWGHVRRGYSTADLEELIGLPCRGSASFISPITVIGHDISFSKLPRPLRRGLCSLLLPITWLGYAVHEPDHVGTETATAWEKPSGNA